MQIIRFYDKENKIHTGCNYKDETACLINGNIFNKFEVTEKRVFVKKLISPIIPYAIFCIGLNYRMHAKETGALIPIYPVVFMKNPQAVTGPFSEIKIPYSCIDPLQVDYETELAVIIGKYAKNIKKENAFKYIFGYTCANDVSARRWQKHAGGGQWVRGKSFDTFCPLGPSIITTQEIKNPQKLTLECRLNNKIMQKSSTSDMIFSVAEIIEFLSQSTTLAPGSVILTGTPSGVGFTRKPPVFLKSGDVLKTSVEKIGTMVNPVVNERIN